MWECQYCHVDIRDKYKFCWNCARPRDVAEQLIEPEQTIESQPIIEPERRIEPEQVEPEETPPVVAPVDESGESARPDLEAPAEYEPVPASVRPKTVEQDFLSGFGSGEEIKPPSRVLQVVPFLLWLVVIGSVGVFAFLSSRKMAAFSEKIETEREIFSARKGEYAFPAKPTMRRGTAIEFAQFRPKVLPLNLKTGGVEPLFSVLPDDLRPTSAEEVRSVMWFDCKNNEVGRYTDGTAGFQEGCTIYLVDRETSKYIAIQDFLGVMPALSKERGGGDAVGRVPSEKYIAFLREKQPENERSAMESAPDSPDHHYFSKSEFIYALLLLAALTAVGLGWLAYKIKFDWDAD